MDCSTDRNKSTNWSSRYGCCLSERVSDDHQCTLQQERSIVSWIGMRQTIILMRWFNHFNPHYSKIWGIQARVECERLILVRGEFMGLFSNARSISVQRTENTVTEVVGKVLNPAAFKHLHGPIFEQTVERSVQKSGLEPNVFITWSRR